MKKIFLVSMCFVLSSCVSYFKRKSCESTNWFEYGQKVALEGRRLTGDQFILECQQADADVAESALDRGFKSGLEKYCLPDTVFLIGKNGKFFSQEMCTGLNINLLLSRHRLGVQEYCQKSNGYAAGTKGEAYNKICPGDLEPAFLQEFNRGRKKYLNVMIDENQKMISRLEREIPSLQSEYNFKKAELMRYQFNNKDEKMMIRYNQIASEVRGVEARINSKQSEITRLQNQNRNYQVEIVGLENQ